MRMPNTLCNEDIYVQEGTKSFKNLWYGPCQNSIVDSIHHQSIDHGVCAGERLSQECLIV